MGARIHPTAVIDPRARIGPDVEVGPYVVVGADVEVGAGTRIGPHACLEGPLTIGEGCELHFAVALGGAPQIKGGKGPWGAVRIGDRCVFREFSQVHRSMKPDGVTRVGDNGFFMAASHVAHDCVVGDDVILVNGALLAGHVEVGDRAFLSGNAAVHQFSRVGELAMVGGGAAVTRDVPPFGMVTGGRPVRLNGLNTVGLRRAGVAPEVRVALREAYRTLFRSALPLPERVAAVRPTCAEVERLVAFVRSTRRGVVGFGGRAGAVETAADAD